MYRQWTEMNKVLDAIHPISSATVVNGAWVSVAGYARIVALVDIGVITATGTVNAKLQQAKDASGTGAKELPIAGTPAGPLAMTQFADSDDNKFVALELEAEDMDTDGGFTHVRLSITPATAAALLQGYVFGFVGAYEPVGVTNFKEVVQSS